MTTAQKHAIIAAVLATTLFSCAQTARQNYAKAQDAYIVALDALIAARASGIIGEEEWRDKVVPAVRAASAALNAFGAATKSGVDGGTAREQFLAAMRELEPLLTRSGAP